MEAVAERPKAKANPVLMPERLGLAESKRHDWVVDVENDVTLDQVLEPAFWAHTAQQMVSGDHIEVRPEDFSWVAYLIVHYAERTYAKVVVDRVVKIEQKLDMPEVSVKHKVEWKGPMHKFGVIRISDSQMLQSGFKTRGEAETWILNHEKAQ